MEFEIGPRCPQEREPPKVPDGQMHGAAVFECLFFLVYIRSFYTSVGMRDGLDCGNKGAAWTNQSIFALWPLRALGQSTT